MGEPRDLAVIAVVIDRTARKILSGIAHVDFRGS
jgi:hypothetical protein